MGHRVLVCLGGQAIGLPRPGERVEVLALSQSCKEVIKQFGAEFVDGTWVGVIRIIAVVIG